MRKRTLNPIGLGRGDNSLSVGKEARSECCGGASLISQVAKSRYAARAKTGRALRAIRVASKAVERNARSIEFNVHVFA